MAPEPPTDEIRPPRWPARLFERVLSDEAADAIFGDLEEEFREVAGGFGRGRAWRGYLWGLTASLLAVSRRTLERRGVLVGLGSDVRQALRSTARQPGVSLLVVGMLGIGIGAMATLFSAADAFLYKPLPFPEPERLVALTEWAPSSSVTKNRVSVPVLEYLREGTDAFSSIGGYSLHSWNLSRGDRAVALRGASIDRSWYTLTGVQPLAGRLFSADEYAERRAVAIVSEGLWEREHAEDPALIGATIRIDGSPVTVIGVLPREGALLAHVDIWMPWSPLPEDRAATGSGGSVLTLARMAPGWTVDTVVRELTRLAPELPALANSIAPDTRIELDPDPVDRRSSLGIVPDLFLIAAGCLLLIVCLNVSALLLARAAQRRSEMAVRSALGGSRRRLVRRSMTESLVLAGAGAAVGLLLARLGIWALSHQIHRLPIPAWVDLGLDARVVVFAIAVGAVSALFFGVSPALEAGRFDLVASLRGDSTHATESAMNRRKLGAFMVLEIGIACTLLMVAGLMVQSFRSAQNLDHGVDPGNVSYMSVTLTSGVRDDPVRKTEYFDDVLRRVESVGGIEHVAIRSQFDGFRTEPSGPDSTSSAGIWEVDGVEVRRLGIDVRVVSDAYFDLVRLPVLHGRTFDATDGATSELVAVVSESFAEEFWPEMDPVGRNIDFRRGESRFGVRIVGVSEDVRSVAGGRRGLGLRDERTIYLARRQTFERSSLVFARTREGVDAPPRSVVERIQSIDPDQAVGEFSSYERSLQADTWIFAVVFGFVFTGLGGIGTLLVVMGLYGLVSFRVARRTREFGTRIALGANRFDIVRLAMRDGLVLAGVGVTFGMVLTIAALQILRTFLISVGLTSALSLIATGLLLVGVAACAAYVPARRAAVVSPVQALRFD